ncbi:MAG: substrate-binding domain-containing protein [Opitutaceae bacterium]|nr:substrate-binding domain-containing protein [Opitutaceae bacterium]
MKKLPFLYSALFFLLVALPLLFQALFFVVAILVPGEVPAAFSWALTGVVAALFLHVCYRAGRRRVLRAFHYAGGTMPEAAAATIPSGFFVRYQPVLAALAYTVLVTLAALLAPSGAGHGVFSNATAIFGLAHATSVFVPMLFVYLAGGSLWMLVPVPLAIYACFGAGMARGFHIIGAPRTPWRSWLGAAGALAAAGIAIFLRADAMRAGLLPLSAALRPAALPDDNTFNRNRQPFEPGNRLPVVENPALSISKNHPRLDGATAAFPIYAAAAQAVYKGLEHMEPYKRMHYIKCSNTPGAWHELTEGRVDVIFVAEPSLAQLAAARGKGVEFRMTPLARDAFVFFTRTDNPVDNLTSEQIRGIYTKRITNWREAGGRDEKILPFQRPEGSGSQTVMQRLVMRDRPLAAPLAEERAAGMGGIIRATAAYRNAAGAIGYSFRVFASETGAEAPVKFLSIDGVAPVPENIRAGAYPFTADVFAVTAGNETPETRALLAWLAGPQGRRLIEATGYVSAPPAAASKAPAPGAIPSGGGP